MLQRSDDSCRSSGRLPSVAAEAVRILTGELLSGSNDISSDFDICSCVVAAAARNTAGGAVMTAGGIVQRL